MRKLVTFKTLSTVGAVVAGLLALTWFVAPGLFFWMWQLEPTASATVLGQRAGALFAGFAVILFIVRGHAPNPTRSALAAGFAFGCGLLAVLGIWAYFGGTAGPGIWLAIFAEIILGLGFARFAR